MIYGGTLRAGVENVRSNHRPRLRPFYEAYQDVSEADDYYSKYYWFAKSGSDNTTRRRERMLSFRGMT
jgi:hypothetical protein